MDKFALMLNSSSFIYKSCKLQGFVSFMQGDRAAGLLLKLAGASDRLNSGIFQHTNCIFH